jgi:hypothetical protein
MKMRKFLSILALIVISLSCKAARSGSEDNLKNPFVLFYLFGNFVGTKNSAIIASVEANLARLTSPIYQIESKGLDSSKDVSDSSSGSFYSNDHVNVTREVVTDIHSKKYHIINYLLIIIS